MIDFLIHNTLHERIKKASEAFQVIANSDLCTALSIGGETWNYMKQCEYNNISFNKKLWFSPHDNSELT